MTIATTSSSTTSTTASSTTASSTTIARQTLLETITERERELIRIRHAADKIVEDEQRASTNQVQSLQSDLIRYQNILQDKDDQIQSLSIQMERMEQEYILQQQNIIDKSKEEVERQIEKCTIQYEKEYNVTTRNYQERETKKLQLEFEDKLLSCEKRIHSEYQNSFMMELQKQEDILWSNFEKINIEKQSRFEKLEKELRDTIHERERDITDLSCQYERNLNMSQTKLMNQLQAEIETLTRRNEEYKRNNDGIRNEKEEIIQRYKCIEEQLENAERENNHFKDKVHDLLEVIHGTEKSYVQKLEQFEYEESERQNEMILLTNQLKTLEETMSKSKSCHRKEMKDMKKKTSQEKKVLHRTIEEVRKEVKTIEKMKKDNEENAHRNLQRKEELIESLSKELEDCKQECKKNQENLIRNEKQEYQLQQEFEMKCENEVRHKMNVQEWKAMFNVEKTKYEGKLRTLTTEKDIVQKDRDESMMVVSRVQKEMMELKLERKLANETAVEEIKKLNEKIRLLELNLSEANSEKSALKGMISKMREEMETLTTMSSPGNQSKPSIPSMNDMNDGTSMLYMLESIFDRLDQSSSKINDSHVIAIKEVLHKICKSFNCFEEMEEEARLAPERSISHKSKIQHLEHTCHELSSELDVVSSERDSLINLSNKLTSDLSRIKRECSFNDQKLEDKRIRNLNSESSNFEDDSDEFGVKDLAKSLWSKALQGCDDETKHTIPLRVSQRATDSQRTSLQKIRRGRNKKSQGMDKSIGKGKMKVRNWNCRDDD